MQYCRQLLASEAQKCSTVVNFWHRRPKSVVLSSTFGLRGQELLGYARFASVLLVCEVLHHLLSPRLTSPDSPHLTSPHLTSSPLAIPALQHFGPPLVPSRQRSWPRNVAVAAPQKPAALANLLDLLCSAQRDFRSGLAGATCGCWVWCGMCGWVGVGGAWCGVRVVGVGCNMGMRVRFT